jgi:hypothetical protein
VNRRDAVGGAALLALGGLVVHQALDLPVGSLRAPGPGFLPLALGIALAAISAAVLVRALIGGIATAGAFDAAGIARPLLVVVAMIAYGAVLPLLGFAATTFLLLAGLFALGASRLLSWQPLASAAVATAALYLLFETALEVGLPAGSVWGP